MSSRTAAGLGLPMKATHHVSRNSSASSMNNNHNQTKTSSSNHNSNMNPAVYLQRLIDVSQMDIQSALDQMKSLLLPAKMNSVYKMAYYRKQTKDHWARDDPAFVAIQIALLVVASLAYAIAFRSDSLLGNFIYFTIHTVAVNYVISGIIIASLARYIANTHLNQSQTTLEKRSYHAHQSVEVMYAVDVHCNAFFFFFICAYGIQFFLLPIVLGKGFFSFLLSNMLYSIAFFGYFYITHLGYREVFLFPLAIVLFIFILNLVGYPFGFGWNASRIMAHLYFEASSS
eukprot:scaffold261_cov318-Chaetoceros_neogracile.AAC.9